MSKLQHEGGPLHPINESDENGNGSFNTYAGISIRDWFAGMIVQGLLASEEDYTQHGERIVNDAFMIADMMLFRSKRPPVAPTQKCARCRKDTPVDQLVEAHAGGPICSKCIAELKKLNFQEPAVSQRKAEREKRNED